jgi:hypothetical protein
MKIALLVFVCLPVLAGCATPRRHDAFAASRQFAAQCHDYAHDGAWFRYTRRAPPPGMDAVVLEVRPVLHPDRDRVRAAERLFLDTYRELPPEERALLAPALVSFGTTATWAVAKSELTAAVYEVRSALVSELLMQMFVAAGTTGAMERVAGDVAEARLHFLLRGLGWSDARPVDAEWSVDEIPAVLAERLLNDTEVRTVEVVDRIPFLPFITSRGSFTISICGQIASDLTGFDPLHTRLQAALDQIRARPDHPAYNSCGTPPVAGHTHSP